MSEGETAVVTGQVSKLREENSVVFEKVSAVTIMSNISDVT